MNYNDQQHQQQLNNQIIAPNYNYPSYDPSLDQPPPQQYFQQNQLQNEQNIQYNPYQQNVQIQQYQIPQPPPPAQSTIYPPIPDQFQQYNPYSQNNNIIINPYQSMIHDDNQVIKNENKIIDQKDNFLSKMFAVLSVQIAISFLFSSCINLMDETKYYIKQNPKYFLLSVLFSLAVLITAKCKGKYINKKPNDKIFITLVTITGSYIICYISITAGSSFILIQMINLFANSVTFAIIYENKEQNLKGNKPYFTSFIVSLSVNIIISFFKLSYVSFFVSCLCCCLLSFFLVYDAKYLNKKLKKKIKKKQKKQKKLQQTNYIFLSMQLYLDLLNFFWISIFNVITNSFDIDCCCCCC